MQHGRYLHGTLYCQYVHVRHLYRPSADLHESLCNRYTSSVGDRQHVHGAVRKAGQGARGAGVSHVLLLSDAHDVACNIKFDTITDLMNFVAASCFSLTG